MTAPTRKYNPGFLSDAELVASYCVRTTEFELLVEVLRECIGHSHPHQLVIGPRGSGKTSLLLRVAAEVRRDAVLESRCFPVVFSEESYEVATAGEFWLECLTNLAIQAPRREDASDLHRTVDELRAIRDDQALADRCLGALLDFADRKDKRLVLIVESLNMLLGDMADLDMGWRLRKILQTEPRIIVFASATSRFEEIAHPDRALYDLFQIRTLRPLDTKQCTVLWETVSGRRSARKTVRSLEILTGGSPRLISIVARFSAGLSFRDLMTHLYDLIDDHTEYFKGHLESLPAQERRVYLALAALWKPATTREIADHARLETSTCSAQLARLVERGVVRVAGGSARRKQYYLTERLYNIYYLLRRRRGPDRLVEALIHFMESYYSPPELKDISARMVHDAGGLGAEMRSLHRIALAGLMELPSLAEYRDELLAMMPPGFVAVSGWGSAPVDVARTTAAGVQADDDRVEPSQGNTGESAERAARELFKTTAASNVRNRAEDTVEACDEVIRRFGKSEIPAVLVWVAKALMNKGTALSELKRPQDALEAWDEVIRRFGESETPALLDSVAFALGNRGPALGALNRPQDALEACDEVIRRFGKSETPALLDSVAAALGNRGAALGALNRPQDALEACDEVIRRFGKSETPALLERVATALVSKGVALGDLNRPQDALEAYDEVVRRFGESETPPLLGSVAFALVNRGPVLGALNRRQDALEAYDEVVRRFGKSETPALLDSVAAALGNRGAVLGALNRPQDALEACDEVVRRFGKSETPALVERVATALGNRGAALGALNRPQDALKACDEVIRRFGKSETPALLERVATALVNRGGVLGALNRLQDALEASDEVIRRFGESETPALVERVAAALGNRGAVLGALNRPQDALEAYDEVVRRFGKSETPALVERVATALGNRGAVLSDLNRPQDALEAYDEVVRRFGKSETPALVERVATTLGNKGAVLSDLNRPQDALEAYDEVVRRFGKSETPALVDSVATALGNRGAVLGALNRPQDALEACDEVVRRFGKSETPALLERVASALVNRGAVLSDLNRPQDTLEACDEVVRRFGKSKTPALLERVASALVNRGAALSALNRPQDALEACDEVVRRFGKSKTQALLERVATALGNKGAVLVALNRPQDALEACDEVIRRFWENDSSVFSVEVKGALLWRADIEIKTRQYEKAVETAGRVINGRHRGSPEQQLRGHVILAKALLAGGDRFAFEHAVEAVLALLPQLGFISREAIAALIGFSVDLGLQRMHELIQTSLSADLLLPLKTALERELGYEPRVAREVDEVAQDIQRELKANLTNMKALPDLELKKLATTPGPRQHLAFDERARRIRDNRSSWSPEEGPWAWDPLDITRAPNAIEAEWALLQWSQRLNDGKNPKLEQEQEARLRELESHLDQGPDWLGDKYFNEIGKELRRQKGESSA